MAIGLSKKTQLHILRLAIVAIFCKRGYSPQGIEIDWNKTEVDLIRPNKNDLIFRKNKLSSKNSKEKIIHYIIIQNNYLFSRIT